MTREEFMEIWGIRSVQVSPPDAMKSVTVNIPYQGSDLWLNFDLYAEEDVYALGAAFFEQLKAKLPELGEFAKQIIAERDLNWNDVELQLSTVSFRKARPGNEGFYSTFALTFEGGEFYDEDDEEYEDGEDYEGEPELLLMHVCFDEQFRFTKAFVETVMMD